VNARDDPAAAALARGFAVQMERLALALGAPAAAARAAHAAALAVSRAASDGSEWPSMSG